MDNFFGPTVDGCIRKSLINVSICGTLSFYSSSLSLTFAFICIFLDRVILGARSWNLQVNTHRRLSLFHSFFIRLIPQLCHLFCNDLSLVERHSVGWFSDGYTDMFILTTFCIFKNEIVQPQVSEISLVSVLSHFLGL
jgi:hypothetical protein